MATLTSPDERRTEIGAPSAGSGAELRSVWSLPHEEVAAALGTDPAVGLSSSEAARRRERYGPNLLREHERKSLLRIALDQFRSLIVWLLVVAAGVAFLFGETLEGWAIVAVIALNAAIGLVSELRAVRSMEALFELGHVSTRVRREGEVRTIDAEDLVPGDVVVVEGGDVVTADLRLVEASKLQADESALTGESVPVGKEIDPADPDASLADRTSMLYKGTALTRGSGAGLVVATGMETELGEISELVAAAEEEATPLEERLDRLGHRLIGVTLVIAVVVAGSGYLAGKELFLMIETGIALAVAAIPEGLPIVATLALARGMQRMARRNALVNRLSSVETLGATTTIFTDKTGTLTENRMTVVQLALAAGEVVVGDVEAGEAFEREGAPVRVEEDPELREALEVAVLCNNASLPEEGRHTGDPMEVALLSAGAKAGIRQEDLLEGQPEVREEAFDPDVKMMATYHPAGSGFRVAVKGAPGAVLEASSQVLSGAETAPIDEAARHRWLERNDAMAKGGLRVLALARKEVDDVEAEPYEELVFIGLVGLVDPPRRDVQPALAACRQAGIEVVMVTGDQPVTARGVAQAVGLIDSEEEEVVRDVELGSVADLDAEGRQKMLHTRVFARVSPRQKLELIDLYQKDGQIVAMTGDGVNDAPALKEADIGIAMGQRGTQVAKEAADMVLQDDAFSTIVAAVEQGRVIFSNIRRFVFYLLSCNVSEVMAVSFAAVAGMMLPILPLQILFLNLVTDVFPALALGVGEGAGNVMKRPPRDPKEPIMGRRHWIGVMVYGALITSVVLLALLTARSVLAMDAGQAVTVSFLTLALAQLWHVFNMRSPGSSLLRNEITQNPYVWGAVALCIGLLLMAVYLPGLAYVLDVQAPGLAGWGVVIGFSLVPLLIGQLLIDRWGIEL